MSLLLFLTAAAAAAGVSDRRITIEAARRATSYPVPAPPVHAPRQRPAGIPTKTVARRERVRRRNLLLVAKGGLEPMDDAAFAAALRVGQSDVRERRGWEMPGLVTGYENIPRF